MAPGQLVVHAPGRVVWRWFRNQLVAHAPGRAVGRWFRGQLVVHAPGPRGALSEVARARVRRTPSGTPDVRHSGHRPAHRTSGTADTVRHSGHRPAHRPSGTADTVRHTGRPAHRPSAQRTPSGGPDVRAPGGALSGGGSGPVGGARPGAPGRVVWRWFRGQLVEHAPGRAVEHAPPLARAVGMRSVHVWCPPGGRAAREGCSAFFIKSARPSRATAVPADFSLPAPLGSHRARAGTGVARRGALGEKRRAPRAAASLCVFGSGSRQTP